MKLKGIIRNIAKKIVREIIYPIHCRMIRRRYGRIDDLTILGINCIAGEIYNVFGCQFKTPTVNMAIEDDNFIKLCKNPDHYFSVDAEPYIENYIEPNTNGATFPLIKVDDIVIRAIHYENCAQACECWNRRRTRVTSKRCIVANTWDLHDNRDLINELLAIDIPKVIYTDMQEFLGRKEFIVLNDKVYYKDQRGKVRPELAYLYWYSWRFEHVFPSIYKWLKSI